jgi:hypothetical protein
MGANGKMVYAIPVKQWMNARYARASYVQADTTLFPPRLEQVTRRQEGELAARLQQSC